MLAVELVSSSVYTGDHCRRCVITLFLRVKELILMLVKKCVLVQQVGRWASVLSAVSYSFSLHMYKSSGFHRTGFFAAIGHEDVHALNSLETTLSIWVGHFHRYEY